MEFKKVILIFAFWRILLFIATFLCLLIPLNSHHFLGGSFDNYNFNPFVFGWANFDGEHYLSIAQKGYGHYNHSFFPVYPLILGLIKFLTDNISILVWWGIIISNISFLAALFFLKKLTDLDFPKKVSYLILLSLIIFPTSFYFGAVYTESLFLFLVVSSFYAARTNRWYLAGVLGAFASTTRIVGVILLPALILEYFQMQKEKSFKSLSPLFLIPLGLMFYMVFLLNETGNPFAFYSELSVYGEQRAGDLILLPQVFYRYLKILTNVDIINPVFQTALLELGSAILAIACIIYGFFKKIRLSYIVFAAVSFLIPTFTGSFSSLPRYFLTIFPLFIAIGIFVERSSLIFKILVSLLVLSLLMFETMLFLRGYFIA